MKTKTLIELAALTREGREALHRDFDSMNPPEEIKHLLDIAFSSMEATQLLASFESNVPEELEDEMFPETRRVLAEMFGVLPHIDTTVYQATGLKPE